MRWTVKTLGEISEVKGGKRVPKGYKLESCPTSHPYITVSDFTDNGTVDKKKLRYISDEVFKQISRYTISSDDLYLSIAGTIGKTGFIPKELDGANLTENACKLVLNGEIDKKFLYYFTKSNDFSQQTGVNTRVAAQPKLALSRLKTISLPVPPLDEQKRIVDILEEAFAGIDTAIANTKKNLTNGRELFESYLNSVFIQRGDGWIDQKFGGICGFVRGPFGGSLKKSCFVDEGFAVYEQQHAINDQFESIRYFIDDKKFQEMQRFELLPGDLIMSCSGTMGRVAIVPDTIKRGVINQALLKLTPSNKIDAQYLRLWMESDSFMEEIEKHSQGAAIKNVASVKVLKEIKVPSPDLSAQKEIVSEILDYREQTNQLESIYQRKLNSLKELKQSLLQKAFSGELTAEADKLMDEAVA